jgi:hypothetical protein
MLDAFIIEELRRREERERNDAQRPMLDIPLDDREFPRPHPRREEEKKSDRGVVVIDI